MTTPVFQINDYHQAVAFYVDWLGFSIDWEDRLANEGYYFQVSRGDIVLHLTTYEHASCGGSRALAEFTGLQAMHRLLRRKNAAFPVPPLQKTTWNDRVMQMELFDPDGNCLVLSEVCV